MLPMTLIARRPKYLSKCRWSLEWAKVNSKYANQKPTCDFLAIGNGIFCPVTVCEIFTVECAWPWPCLLEWTEVEGKYANRKVTCDFLCVSNSNVCPICHRLRDNQVWKYSRFESLTLKMKSRSLTIWMKTGWRTYPANVQAFAKTGISRYSHLFAVHNRIFDDGRTYIRTKMTPFN